MIIAAIAAIFVIPVVIVVNILRSNASAADRDPAMGLLRQRLAKGEIDETEFQRLRSALQGR
jgi:uncharacterized membrane protein